MSGYGRLRQEYIILTRKICFEVGMKERGWNSNDSGMVGGVDLVCRDLNRWSENLSRSIVRSGEQL